jgi:hypothetical protein
VGFAQLDDGIGCMFVRAVLEKPCKKRTRRHAGNADKSRKEIICVEVPAYIAALDCAPHQGRIASCADPGSFERPHCLSLAKLAAVVEVVEGDFSKLADLDEVAVGITHIAAPFPAVIV